MVAPQPKRRAPDDIRPMPPAKKKKSKEKKKICRCKPTCGKPLSYKQRRKHYTNSNPDTAQPALSITSSGTSEEEHNNSDSDNHQSTGNYSSSDIASESDVAPDASSESDAHSNVPSSDDDGSELGDIDNDNLIGPPSEDEQTVLDLERELDQADNDDDEYIHTEHMLTDEERDNIRAFQLRLLANMPRASFNFMRHAFRHKLKISSEWVMLHRIAKLSGIEPKFYDCCAKNCAAFTGEWLQEENCPICEDPRYDDRGKAKRVFCYISLIDQLRGLYESKKMAKEMLHRSGYVPTGPAVISDVFDGALYLKSLRHRVVIQGVKQDHKYFDGPRDVAISVCTDGFLLFDRRRSGPSATPILCQNYNLPPTIRTHSENLICVGVIPGPNAPKHMGSFRRPLEDDLIKLAGPGVSAYDAHVEREFCLRAYQLFELGDIVAAEKSLGIKGHNGYCPCRSCALTGIRDVEGNGKVYYIPLRAPDGHPPTQKPRPNPPNLPLRSHRSFQRALDKIDAAETTTEKNNIAKAKGIKKPACFGAVGLIDYGKSVPWDWMHLFLENVIQNLFKFWRGEYKGLDEGEQSYEIAPHIWNDIGDETAAAVENIPAHFVRVLRNINTDRSGFTAESWCFWFIYLAPILLRGRFKETKYYKHMCKLVTIMKTSLKYSLTSEELDILEADIIEWVRDYEKYYYQYRSERLSACVLTIHGLLHVVDDIRNCGPSWTTWTFFMERFCGLLKRALRSRRHPWANLTKRTLHLTMLNQLKYRYDLHEELSLPPTDRRNRDEGVRTRNENEFDDYPEHILLTPCIKRYAPDANLRAQIAYYWHILTGRGKTRIEPLLPKNMASWAKVRIDGLKTTIRSSSAHNTGRDASFVRYENRYEDEDGEQINVIGYGQFVRALVCTLPEKPIFDEYSGKTRLLAVVIPCNTRGKDARNELVKYKENLAPLVMDIRDITALVGRVKTRGKWYILDRFDAAVPTFGDKGEMEQDNGLEDDDE
ncbi:hypothetical protein D9611_004820 [Ephemerocybe angulata]|uniref:Transposase family Tnp2 protein n=1 Tax=Ephemerocybe angulata TaxID=980116 RepID=A0A8H5B4D6_9AGAR|nr:hypothetical protein D9611_004820 [Tulosesus angulatus]